MTSGTFIDPKGHKGLLVASTPGEFAALIGRKLAEGWTRCAESPPVAAIDPKDMLIVVAHGPTPTTVPVAEVATPTPMPAPLPLADPAGPSDEDRAAALDAALNGEPAE